MNEFRFKRGEDVSHLFRVVVTSGPDSDGDYYLEVESSDGSAKSGMSSYFKAEALDNMQREHEAEVAIKAVTGGGIDSIEKFLEA